jgi:hypothetical protein
MAVVASGNFPIDPTVVDGTQLANILNEWMTAYQSSQASPTRPPTIIKGGVWTKTLGATDIALMLFDGTKDIEIGKVVGGSASFGGAGVSTTAPATATTGQMWVDSTTVGTPILKIYNGTAWVSATRVITANDANPGLKITQTGTGPALLVQDEADPDATPFVIDNAGNVGIGTDSPTQKVTVTGNMTSTVAGTFYIDGGTAGIASFPTYSFASDTDTGMWRAQTNTLNFSTGGTERLRIDASGNLGLGVTPSAFGSVFKALQVGSGSVYSVATGNNATVGSNIFHTGATFNYITNGEATQYSQVGGQHKWYTAPPGTAGNAISFTQAMTLNEHGNLLVGKTSGSFAFTLAGKSTTSVYAQAIYADTADATTHFMVAFKKSDGATIGEITHDGVNTTSYNTSSDYRLKNITGPITTSGAYIDSLNPVEGTWKADGSTFVGLIAHEVQEASRTAVATGVKDGEQMQGMDYSSAEIIANLIAEVKSLRARVATLESN